LFILSIGRRVGVMIEKMRFLVAFVTIVALMAVTLMPVDMALGREANPARTLPEAVHKGETFDVTVTFTAPADKFSAISITDLVPEDWNVTVSTAWCTPNADAVLARGNKAEIVWYGEPGVGFDNGTSFSVLYEVAVPDDASRGIYTFSGFLGYYVGYSGHIFEDVTGDSEVEVVLAARPIISFSPASLSFSAAQGGSNPANKALEISNSGVDILNWTLSDDADWLSQNPTSGSSSGTDDTTVVTVSVNTTGMSVGDYSASITITADGVSNSLRTVPVSLYMGKIAPPPQPWLNRYWWMIVAGIVGVVILVYLLRRRRSA
jgi:hypothetical protein